MHDGLGCTGTRLRAKNENDYFQLDSPVDFSVISNGPTWQAKMSVTIPAACPVDGFHDSKPERWTPFGLRTVLSARWESKGWARGEEGHGQHSTLSFQLTNEHAGST